jgi:hypothetical protein
MLAIEAADVIVNPAMEFASRIGKTPLANNSYQNKMNW